MKRAAFPLMFFLFGFLLGLLCLFPLRGDREQAPAPAGAAPAEGARQASSAPSTTALLQAAAQGAEALEARDYEALAALTDPERGVTFTLYSTVDPSRDQTFTPDQLRAAAQSGRRYLWGYEDGRGGPIRLTLPQLLDQYFCTLDYTQAASVGVDQIILSGNALENVAEAYPGCRFVDFCFPGTDPEYGGMDWSSLKLVFTPGPSGWLLVGLIHSQWTI